MKLLVLNWQDRLNPQAGGAETHLHEVFGRLAARGHDVTLLVSGWSDAPAGDRIDDMHLQRVGGRYSYNIAAPVHYRRRLRGLFDVVVEDLNKVPLFTPLWVREPLVLLVHHLFGATAFQEASLPLAGATWLLERPLPTVYRGVPVQAVSESTADDLARRGLRRENVTVIPNGVALARFAPDEGAPRFETPTLLYLGRLKRYKRVDLVVRASRLLRDRGVEHRLVIAGTGDQETRLRALVSELGLADIVDMPGFVPESRKVELFRRAWVHVFTSPKEGWGISNLEAAAAGTATVASDSPGLRESVVHGRTGSPVPHGDTAALTDRLEEILRDPGLRERLGRQARSFARHFTWDAAADRTERHLHDVVRRGAPAQHRSANHSTQEAR